MESRVAVTPAVPGDPSWIAELSDEQCMEIFWLYVESPDEFLSAHPAPLLGAAMRYALREVLAGETTRGRGPATIAEGAAEG